MNDGGLSGVAESVRVGVRTRCCALVTVRVI
jgi:hypothetical protein